MAVILTCNDKNSIKIDNLYKIRVMKYSETLKIIKIDVFIKGQSLKEALWDKGSVIKV